VKAKTAGKNILNGHKRLVPQLSWGSRPPVRANSLTTAANREDIAETTETRAGGGFGKRKDMAKGDFDQEGLVHEDKEIESIIL